MIKTSNLTKRYGQLTALEQVTFSVQRGEIAGVLGPNGAGKTTLFKILTGLIKATSGSFSIESAKPKKIGAIIENPQLYEYLSAQENLQVFAQYQQLALSKADVMALLTSVGLDPNRKDQVKNFSLGMKQRLGIATALLNAPDALILDEPFLGLDPMGMKDLREMLIRLAKEEHMAILVSSHQLEELSKVCEQLHLLQQGKIINSGRTAEILHKATQQYRLVGAGIGTSPLLAPFTKEIHGDVTLFSSTPAEAKAVIKALILEGHDIESFGPELNLNDLYSDQ